MQFQTLRLRLDFTIKFPPNNNINLDFSKTTTSTDAPVCKVFVPLVHLFQKDEGEDGVWSEPEVVRRKTFPQTKEAFRPDDASEDVSRPAILGLPIDNSHVLNSRLGDVHRHRSDRCD